MKKLVSFAIMMLMILTAGEAAAFHGHHRPKPFHHTPRRVVVHHHGDMALSFVGGLLGAAVGTYAVSSRPVYQYYPENEKQCYVVVSKSTGNITKKCLSVSDNSEVLYVD